jgi:hypothetical protein
VSRPGQQQHVAAAAAARSASATCCAGGGGGVAAAATGTMHGSCEELRTCGSQDRRRQQVRRFWKHLATVKVATAAVRVLDGSSIHQ